MDRLNCFGFPRVLPWAFFNKLLLFVFFGLCLHSSIVFSSAISNSSQPISEKTRPVLAIIDFFPFGYSLDNKKAQGMVFDIAKLVEQLSGIKFDARLIPVPRALRGATLGQIDLLFSYKDPVMVPDVTFLGNVGCLTSLIVPHKNSNIHSFDDLKDKRIGYVGLGYFAIRHKNSWPIKHVVLNDNFLMLKMLIRQRLDAIVINNGVLNAFLANPQILNDLPENWMAELGQPLPLETFETHLSMSNKSSFKHLIPKLQETIAKANKKKLFEAILRQYGSDGYCFYGEELEQHQWLPL